MPKPAANWIKRLVGTLYEPENDPTDAVSRARKVAAHDLQIDVLERQLEALTHRLDSIERHRTAENAEIMQVLHRIDHAHKRVMGRFYATDGAAAPEPPEPPTKFQRLWGGG